MYKTSGRFNTVSALKVLSIVVGATAYGLGVYSYDETNIEEEFFLRFVQAYLVISIVYFTVILLSELVASSEFNKAIVSRNGNKDITFHITGAVILLFVSGILIYYAVDNERKLCDLLHITYPEEFCQFYREKIAAGVITILNGTLYALIAVVIFLTHMNKKTKCNSNNLYKVTFQHRPKPKSFYFGTG